ncbi:MAG: TonB-dependent receptor [Synergistaceae bacterium]|jgi:outer membrane cobalamin receptor|nr:TonB-dependent receptor [Synergistaceae bacterium]
MTAFDGRGAEFAPRQKNRLRAFLLSFLLIAAAWGPQARAAVELPEEVVIDSAVHENEEEDKYLSPGAVTVVRPAEYAGEQRTLPDLLEEVPGLRVIRLQGRNGYAVASIRGSTSAQVAVYVDGTLMNLQSESAVDLSSIPVDNVERVEVYRGYIPARFGAQAMGGVVNIVTKFPDKPKTNVSLGIGSFGRRKGNLSHSTRLGDGKFFGSFGYETYGGDFEYWNDNGTPYIDSDGYTGERRGNGFDNTDILLKWEDEHWRARASWIRRDRELALTAPGMDKPGVPQAQSALLDTSRWDVSIGRDQVSGSIHWGWGLSRTGQEKDYDSRQGNTPTSPIGGPNVSKSGYDSTRTGISLHANTPVGEHHFFELLAEYSDERLHVDGDPLYIYLGGIEDYRRTDWNFDLQDTITLDRAGTFLFTPSIRWHSVDGEGHFTWQAALSKEFSSNWMLKGTFGTYARSPNLYEQYGDGAFILPAESALAWETGTQLDIGVIWNGDVKLLGDARASASLSGFMRETDDLVEFQMTSPRYGRYFNIAQSEVKGMELQAALDWEKWNISLSGTWMDGINRTPDIPGSVRYDGMKLPNRPEWSGTARLTRKFGRGSAFVEYQYVGKNYIDSSEKYLFDARNVFNVGVKYDVSPTARLTVGVNDVFGDADDWRMRPDPRFNGPTQVLWYPVEGRSYYLTLDVDL